MAPAPPRAPAPRPSPSTAPTGSSNWYKTRFDEFTKETGVAVNLVEAGSGEVVSRVEKEQSNPQADIVVTLPPFIQKADAQGLLQPSGIDTSAVPADEKDPAGKYVPVVNNYLTFIANPGANPAARDLGRPARRAVQGQAAVLHPRPGR